MISLFRNMVVRLLRVPPEPPAPFGDEQSLLVFRASPRYFQYLLITWFLGRGIGAVAGIVVLIAFSGAILGGVKDDFLRVLLIGLELLGVLLFVVQSILSLAMLRLDYEMRWYKVTDRSLRIREGIWFVREMTMTFANIQNMSITQGPIQRLLGISDLQVQTAGGGGSIPGQQHQQQPGVFPMHIGVLRGVDNAEHIREKIRERLKHLKDSGLGDHDDRHRTVASHPAKAGALQGAVALAAANGGALTLSPAVMNAASDLLAEAVEFRRAAQRFERARNPSATGN